MSKLLIISIFLPTLITIQQFINTHTSQKKTGKISVSYLMPPDIFLNSLLQPNTEPNTLQESDNQ